jgi:hypothetical protein
MKSEKTSKNTALSTSSKKIAFKAIPKAIKVCVPRLAANHNDTLLMA